MPGEAAAIVASAAAPVAPPVVETPAAPVLGADGKPAPIAAPAKDAAAFAALAQAEKVKREGVLQLKSERTKLDQERQAIAAEKAVLEKSKRELAEYADWKAKAKASPLDVMKALGIDYDAATAQRLNGGKPTAEQIVAPLAEKLTTLEQKLAQEREEGTKAAQAKRQAEIAEVEKQFEASCASFVEGSDKHPLTKVYEGSHLVGEVIREHWKQQEASAEVEGTTPKMLSIQEAADLVADFQRTLGVDARPDPPVAGGGARQRFRADIHIEPAAVSAASRGDRGQAGSAAGDRRAEGYGVRIVARRDPDAVELAPVLDGDDLAHIGDDAGEHQLDLSRCL